MLTDISGYHCLTAGELVEFIEHLLHSQAALFAVGEGELVLVTHDLVAELVLALLADEQLERLHQVRGVGQRHAAAGHVDDQASLDWPQRLQTVDIFIFARMVACGAPTEPTATSNG